jgi:hypothetical protein
VWAGATFANRGIAPFRVTQGGGVTVVGGTVMSAASGGRIEFDSDGFRAYKLFEVVTSGASSGILRISSGSPPGALDFAGAARLVASDSTGEFWIMPPSDDTGSVYVGPGGQRWKNVWIASTEFAQIHAGGSCSILLGANLSEIKLTATRLGFYTTNPITKPTVTGDWIDDPVDCARQTLQRLASLGLVTDNTTS